MRTIQGRLTKRYLAGSPFESKTCSKLDAIPHVGSPALCVLNPLLHWFVKTSRTTNTPSIKAGNTV
jgi:hypothetical protein